MFSPLNDPQVEQWFQRLNAPLKRLPAEEHAALHQEVRQHLEALAAANEELGSSPEEAWEHALEQFGEPNKLGKHMAWEWRRKQGFLGPQTAAVLYGIAACSVSMIALAGINWLVMALPYYTMNIILVSNPLPVLPCGLLGIPLGIPIVTGAAVGWKYPRRALKGAFYAACLWPGLPASTVFLACLRPCLVGSARITDWPFFVCACLAFPAWFSLTCGAAYLASATKRGWYKPTWEDFKLTWPKRQIAH